VSLSVHVDVFADDRARNTQAMNELRAVVESDLLAALPAHSSIDWSATAPHGKTQSCRVYVAGGMSHPDAARDARWLTEAALSRLPVLTRHDVRDLRRRVERSAEHR
jgi:hypothetical protein